MCNNNLRIITELANKIKKIIADIFNLNTNMTELDNKIDTKVTELDSRIDILEKKTIECKGSEAIDVDEDKKVSLKLGDNEEVLNIQQDGLHFNKELIDTERTNAINSKATEIINKVDRDLLSYRTINDYNFTDSVLRANSITFNSTSNDIIKVPNSFRVKSTETIFESPFSYRINGIKMLSTSKDGGLYLKTKEDKDLFKINPEGKQLAYYGMRETPMLEIGGDSLTINDISKIRVTSGNIELNPYQFEVRGYSQPSPDSDLVRTALFKVMSGDASDYPGQVIIKNLISDDKALFKNSTTFASDIIIADGEDNPQLKIKNEDGMICDISDGGYKELGTIKSLFENEPIICSGESCKVYRRNELTVPTQEEVSNIFKKFIAQRQLTVYFGKHFKASDFRIITEYDGDTDEQYVSLVAVFDHFAYMYDGGFELLSPIRIQLCAYKDPDGDDFLKFVVLVYNGNDYVYRTDYTDVDPQEVADIISALWEA